MTKRSKDEWDAKAAEKLPCVRCGEVEDATEHGDDCPAHYRPAVAAALRKAYRKGREDMMQELTTTLPILEVDDD